MSMYSLTDFTDISNKGFDVILPTSTIQLINELSKLVGSPNYIKTPVFTKRESITETDKKRRRQRNRQTEGADGWSSNFSTKGTKKLSPSMENDTNPNIVFNPSGLLTKRGGGDVTPIQLVRPLLNKLGGNSTNQAIKDELFTTLNDIIDTDITKEDLDKFTIQVFEILSGNTFYSSIYSQLFSQIMDTYPVFTDTLEKQISKYMTTFTDIKSVDPKEDYDLFCSINKQNDIRKSKSTFFVNLYTLYKISQPTMLSTVKTLTGMIRDNIDNADMVQLVCELIENIFIYMNPELGLFNMYKDTMMHAYSDGEEISISICDYIVELSKTSQKVYSGLNTKSLFKLKDLVDNYTKTIV